MLFHALGVEPHLGHGALAEGLVALAAGSRGVFDHTVKGEAVAIVGDGVELAEGVGEGAGVLLDILGRGPGGAAGVGAGAGPGGLGAAGKGRLGAAGEDALDEAAVVRSEELLGEGLGLEPVAVGAGRRPDRAERVEHGQAADALGPVDGELEGDDAAPVVGDDGGPLDIEGVHEIDDVLPEHGAVDADAGLVRAAEAARIGRKEGVVAGEGGELLAPLVGGLGEAVKEDDGLARPFLQVVHAQVGGLDVAGFHAGLLGVCAGQSRLLRPQTPRCPAP